MANNFISLNQTARSWWGITAAPNGDVYAAYSTNTTTGGICKQTGGVGDFVSLNQTARNWYGMAAAPNGNVYACVPLGSGYPGDIYMQTGGVGDFIALGQTSRAWRFMAAAPNGDVYATYASSATAGGVCKQTGGVGAFVSLGQTARYWYGMAAAPNGDVYASVITSGGVNGDIYKQTGGVGDFISLNQTARVWGGMTAAPNGDVYASVFNVDIFKQISGLGDFVALNELPTKGWRGMAATLNGDVYVSVGSSGSIYEQNRSPNISVQPVSATKAVRDNATFSVTATGFPTPTYQWYFKNTAMTNEGRISGATTNTLTITKTLPTDVGNYTVVASNGVSPNATSNIAVLTISPETFGNGRGDRQPVLNETLSARFRRPFGQMYDRIN